MLRIDLVAVLTSRVPLITSFGQSFFPSCNCDHTSITKLPQHSTNKHLNTSNDQANFPPTIRPVEYHKNSTNITHTMSHSINRTTHRHILAVNAICQPYQPSQHQHRQAGTFGATPTAGPTKPWRDVKHEKQPEASVRGIT